MIIAYSTLDRMKRKTGLEMLINLSLVPLETCNQLIGEIAMCRRANFVKPMACILGAGMLWQAPAVNADVIVTPTSMGAWAFDHRDANGIVDSNSNGVGAMVNGPATPPLGTGSVDLPPFGGRLSA